MEPSISLTDAIRRADLEGVRHFMEAGSNPYARDAGQPSALEAWLENQGKTNLYTIEMGGLLLASKPSSPQDEQVLDELVASQASRLAVSLGEADVGHGMGLDVEASRTGIQSLAQAQACWSMVRATYINARAMEPVVSASLYVSSLGLGMARAHSLLATDGQGGAMLRATPAKVQADPFFEKKMAASIAASVDANDMTVLPMGAVATRASPSGEAYFVTSSGIRPAYGDADRAGYFANTFRPATPPSIVQAIQQADKLTNPSLSQAWALVEAVNRADLDAVRHLMDEGANPYAALSGQGSALEAWVQSQGNGNPYTTEMGRLLLGAAPAGKQDKQVLQAVVNNQVAKLARSLGEAEAGHRLGIDVAVSRTTTQTLGDVQSCWSMVHEAYTRVHGSAPVVSAELYAHHLSLGFVTASALLVPVEGGQAMMRSPLSPIRPDPVLSGGVYKSLLDTACANRITVLPNGSVASQFPGGGHFVGPYGSTPAAEHFAAHLFEALEKPTIRPVPPDPNQLAGRLRLRGAAREEAQQVMEKLSLGEISTRRPRPGM